MIENAIIVSPTEFRELRDLADRCDEGDTWQDGKWYSGVRAILGNRTPQPYTGPYELEVDWTLP